MICHVEDFLEIEPNNIELHIFDTTDPLHWKNTDAYTYESCHFLLLCKILDSFMFSRTRNKKEARQVYRINKDKFLSNK